ncbi:AAA family ATPase [Prosthecobacter vanneervenii]|uniref:Putative ATP-binding protein involved in virulence n=1 Tax=Prosthecobacter vanneervenii TaxID=48466 RepID=A0A7W8DJ91_9BACT|nr:AAA family ATPase [Prosthecobacter vanneervenii]MBB5031879.1 putative ATP-binding protein involved in virulence [Prosthecobacter vanneervenii]
MAKPSETLTIEGFGGLKNAQIVLRPFTLLIGPQSAGKSIITKLLHFFKKVPSEVFQAAKNDQSWKNFSDRSVQRFLKYFPDEAWPKKAFKITLTNSDATYTIESSRKSDAGVSIQFPNFLHTELDELKHSTVDQELTERLFVERSKQHLGKTMCYHQRLIPAGRSFFASLEDNIFSLASEIDLDPFIAEFGHYYRKLRQISNQNSGSSRARNKLLTSAADLIQSILKGTHHRDGKRDYVLMPDGRRTPLSLCSSGQQESLPLLLFLRHIIGSQSLGIPEGLSIEEPEAHLFPDSQRAIVELIAFAFNSSDDLAQVTVTTHSPFILGAVNVLLKAGSLHGSRSLNKNQLKKLDATVPKSRVLKTQQVAAWLIDRGTCQDLISPQTNLIDDNPVDAALGGLIQDFDTLLSLEN